jgi:PKD domain
VSALPGAQKRRRRWLGAVAAVALLFPPGLLAAAPAGAAPAHQGVASLAAATVPPNMDSHLPLPWFGHHVHIHNLFWDTTGWDAHNRFSEQSINAATSALVRSGYFDGLQQYGIPHPAFDGSIDSVGICRDPGTGVTMVETAIFMACEGATPFDGVAFRPVPILPTPVTPTLDIYNVFVPDRTIVDNQDGTTMCKDWGAEHLTSPTLEFYALLPASCAKDVGALMGLVSHEDVETLTDPVLGLGLWDTASVGTLSLHFPTSYTDAIVQLATIFVYVQAVLGMKSEISDVCEAAGPYTPPSDFQEVPASAFGIRMEVASYWSNAAHACVVGGSGARIVETTFTTAGLPAGAPAVMVSGPPVLVTPGVTQWTQPTTDSPFVATESSSYSFPDVTVNGVTFFPSSGNCSGQVGFPNVVATPSTQALTLTCTYSQVPGSPGTGQPPDVPPSVSAGPPVTGDETAPIWLSGSVTDPDDTPAINWSVTSVSGTTDPGATCTFADPAAAQTAVTCSDEGVYTVTLTANDGVNPPVSSSTTVTVNNLGPSLALTMPLPWQPFQAPAAVSLTAPITDPGANDTHTCTINWDDGTPPETFAQEGSCNRAHTFTAPGVYTIKVTVTDDDQRSATASGIVVVFDPGAGFVTGGGWINSPPGAYTPDPTVGGKVHFTMQARYPAGSTTPTGNVSVRLQDIKLTMDATVLDWLVVSPNGEAAVKGSGTLGGQDVRFILYGYQGCGGNPAPGCQPGTDKFRAVIWPAAQGTNPTGPFIYDNVPGADLELADAGPQPLGGGNMQIHS